MGEHLLGNCENVRTYVRSRTCELEHLLRTIAIQLHITAPATLATKSTCAIVSCELEHLLPTNAIQLHSTATAT